MGTEMQIQNGMKGTNYGELEKYLKSKWNQHFAKALDEEKKGSLLE